MKKFLNIALLMSSMTVFATEPRSAVGSSLDLLEEEEQLIVYEELDEDEEFVN